MKHALVLSVLLGAMISAAYGQEPAADLVLVNGRVLTVDGRFSQAEALAVRDGVFVAVGSNEEIRKLADDATRLIDAEGRTVVPGLVESHVHATGVARGDLTAPFIQLGSIAEIQDWVRQQAKKLPRDTWIQLPRADVTRIREGRIPTPEELDLAAPDRPVVFNWQYATEQIQVLNAEAMRIAGIRADTPVPARGKIETDAEGKPTGVIVNAGKLIARFLERPKPSESAYLDNLERLMRTYNQLGITSISERNTNVAGYRAYESLKQQGRLPMRVNVTIRVESDGSVESTEKFIRSLPFHFGDGDDQLRVGPLKIAVDGGILYGTAYMREPYGEDSFTLYHISDPHYRGGLQAGVKPEHVENMIRTGHRLGWQMSSHVTGDAGVDLVLDAVEAAHRDSPINSRRYTLIHAYFPNPETAQRAARLGVLVDTQPAWYYKDGDALAAALGKSRLENFIGVAEWLRAGVKVALNSDHMQGFDPDRSLNPYNPFLAMQTAITRETEYGQVFGPEQRISREQALRAVTIDAAWFSFDESRKGSIETGKLADFAVLTDDPMTCDPQRIKDIRALTTIVGGRVVYQR